MQLHSKNLKIGNWELWKAFKFSTKTWVWPEELKKSSRFSTARIEIIKPSIIKEESSKRNANLLMKNCVNRVLFFII